jgi:hypothetical protein
MSIASECFLVNITVGKWAGYKLDKEASAETAHRANAEVDAIKVSKHLVSQEVIRKISTLDAQLRNHVKKYSLPWKESGDRIMPRRVYQQFIMEHAKLKEDYFAAVDDMIENHYVPERARARFRLGDLFKESDYPEPHQLKRRFYVTLEIDPVTESNDFRVKMSNKAETEEMKAEVEKQFNDRINRALGEVWEAVEKAVSHFAESMNDPEKRFTANTLEKVQGMVDKISVMNVANDPGLNEVADKIAERLSGFTADELRNDAKTRKRAAKEAQKIVEDMGGLMNAFKKVT